ncbi:MAG: hypothetical protein ACD_45C00363G0001 [uncultured bacterium]|nr:MAG: hypothetical protein ACD_45C00363G0001 [uncultured bacterium]
MIAMLIEQIKLARTRHFASRSEKIHPNQLSLFPEAEMGVAECPIDSDTTETVETAEPVAEHTTSATTNTRKKSGRRPLPDYLPRVEVVHELDESAKQCACGATCACIGSDITEQLDIIPMTVQVIRHVRYKYACRQCEEGVKIAPLPAQPIPQSIATAGTLAHVLISKYDDHLPLYRQAEIFERSDVHISRSTLCHWVIKSGQLLQPLMPVLQQNILQYDVGYADETRVQVLKEPNRTAESQSYMWVFGGGPPDKRAWIYQYHASRAGSIPHTFWKDFTGYLHTDAYAGYNGLTQITRVYCWAHARRRFAEIVKTTKKIGVAHETLKRIQQLYRLEEQARQANHTPEQILEMRQTQSKPLLEKLQVYLIEKAHNTLPQSTLGKAIGYTLNHWDGLLNYLQDGRLEIDNNRTERCIKPFAVGRKNWLFSHSVSGVEASSVIYSLIETCKANDIDPYEYLRYALETMPTIDKEDASALQALLPFECIPQLARAKAQRVVQPIPTSAT